MKKTQKKIDVPSSTSRFAAGNAKFDGERFTLVPFSGQVFDHFWWGKMTFDAEGIQMRKNVIPAFKDHSSGELVGEIDSIEKKDGRVELSGKFLDTEAAREIKLAERLEWECSLAFDLSTAVIEEVGESAEVEVNGAKFSGPGTVIREAKLHEISFTHFGAVPDTETSFKEGKKISVSIFSEEETMSEDLKKAQDEAKAEAFGLFSEMSAICEDKTFVAECYEKKMSIQEFQTALIDKQKSELSKLNDQLVEANKKIDEAKNEGVQAADFTPQEGDGNADEDPKSFTEMAHEIAKTEKISIRDAYSRVAKSNPDLYEDHLNNCPLAKK